MAKAGLVARFSAEKVKHNLMETSRILLLIGMAFTAGEIIAVLVTLGTPGVGADLGGEGVWHAMEEQESRAAGNLFRLIHAPAELFLENGPIQALGYLMLQLVAIVLVARWVQRLQFKSVDRKLFTEKAMSMSQTYRDEGEKTMLLLRRWTDEIKAEMSKSTRKLVKTRDGKWNQIMVQHYHDKFEKLLDKTSENYEILLDNYISTTRNQNQEYQTHITKTIQGFDQSVGEKRKTDVKKRKTNIKERRTQVPEVAPRRTATGMHFDFFSELSRIKGKKARFYFMDNFKRRITFIGFVLFGLVFVQWATGHYFNAYFVDPQYFSSPAVPVLAWLSGGIALTLGIIWWEQRSFKTAGARIHHRIQNQFEAVGQIKEVRPLDKLIPPPEVRQARDQQLGARQRSRAPPGGLMTRPGPAPPTGKQSKKDKKQEKKDRKTMVKDKARGRPTAPPSGRPPPRAPGTPTRPR